METITPDNRTDEKRGYTLVLSSPYIMTGKEYYDRYTAGSSAIKASGAFGVPEKIQKMLDLYEYGDRSFLQKCRVFYRQGMFMKDYEDDALWYGYLERYYPVYHDLNIRQLRGYFAWRTQIRRGRFSRTCTTFVYLYLNELLNGIGAGSPEDSFSRLEGFYKGYIDTNMGDPAVKRNLRRWLTEFSIINGFPEECVRRYADKESETRAQAISALRDPEAFSDEEVVNSLIRLSSSAIASSPVITKYEEKGKHLFAEVWRHLPDEAFRRCFGDPEEQPWHPLAGAVYWEQRGHLNMEYDIDSCRKYICRDGEWRKTDWDGLSADRNAFLSLLHMMDLKLRRSLKTGHYLHMKQGEEWAREFVGSAFMEMQREAAEAARPKVCIDLSGLDRIREDAGATCASLLTEEDLDHGEQDACSMTAEAVTANGLDEVQTALLKALLEEADERQSELKEAGEGQQEHGEDPVQTLINERHLMPSVMADAINEALYDDIGDSVIECENGRLSLIEDYIEDISIIVGGNR